MRSKFSDENMNEIWLHANRRLAIPIIAVLDLAASGVAAAAFITGWGTTWGTIAFALAAAVVMLVVPGLFFVACQPRISSDGRTVKLGVRFGLPVAVPIEFVEAFLLGKGPTYLPGYDDYRTEATTLIVKLADRAAEFEKLETNLRIAAWCGHYVTFRGTWTEPLSVELVNRLNERLHAAQQAVAVGRSAKEQV